MAKPDRRADVRLDAFSLALARCRRRQDKALILFSGFDISLIRDCSIQSERTLFLVASGPNNSAFE